MGAAIARWLRRPQRRRASPAWDELAAWDLRGAPRARLAAAYAARANEETAAMEAFTELADELAEAAAPAHVVAAVRRVVADEVHHAALCRRAAEALGWSGDPSVRLVRSDKRYPARERTALVIVHSLCLAESWSAAVFADALPRTAHPVLRAIEADILAEEVTHGRLGFAWLADTWMALPYSTRLLVEHTLPASFRDLEARQPAARRALLIDTLVERVLPALDRTGMRATRAWERRNA